MISPVTVRVRDDALFHPTAVATEGYDFDAREAGMRKNIAHVHHRPASRTVGNDRCNFSDFEFAFGTEKHG
jgi:hypothetical protein